MLRAFREGRDLHRETAMKVLGVSRPTPEQRSTAKAINFGLLYGMGAERFVVYARMEYGLTLSVEEAEEIRAAFFRAYPGLRAYYRRCMEEARRTGAIRTPFGRIRHLPGVGFPEQAGTVYTTAINTPIQATASDLNTLVLLAWRPRVAERGGRLLLPVHDSTLWEVPKGTESTIGGAICSWIRNELVGEVRRKFGVTITCPLDAEAKAGQRWGAMTPLDDRAQSR
jgi:DNA polymerase-1